MNIQEIISDAALILVSAQLDIVGPKKYGSYDFKEGLNYGRRNAARFILGGAARHKPKQVRNAIRKWIELLRKFPAVK